MKAFANVNSIIHYMTNLTKSNEGGMGPTPMKVDYWGIIYNVSGIHIDQLRFSIGVPYYRLSAF